MIETVVGANHIARQDLTGFSLFYWFNRTYASHPSPHMMEAFKLGGAHECVREAVVLRGADRGGIRDADRVLDAAAHVLPQRRRDGARGAVGAGLSASEAWRTLENWIQRPLGPNGDRDGVCWSRVCDLGAAGLGEDEVLELPAAPAGIRDSAELGRVAAMDAAADREHGEAGDSEIRRAAKTYRKALPFFLGLILGRSCIGSLWTLVGSRVRDTDL